MIKLNINDRAFSHQPCSIKGTSSDKITWVHDGSGDSRFHFYTNHNCFDPFIKNNVKRIAWLTEPRPIVPDVYANFHQVASRFDLILTHDDELLKLPNAKWIHGGGSYVGIDVHGGGEEKIYPKTKLCSFFSSNKMMCQYHIMRRECAIDIKYGSKYNNIDTFGGFDLPNPPWEPIMDTLKDYAFSVIFENHICNTFWTEKLNNCFLTGTIPIYIGAYDIGNYFDTKGMYRFYTKEKLNSILDKLTFEDYNSKMESIQSNFENAKSYRMMENYIYDIIKGYL